MDGDITNEFTSSSGIVSTVSEFGNSYRDAMCKLDANANQNKRPCNIRMSVSEMKHSRTFSVSMQ